MRFRFGLLLLPLLALAQTAPPADDTCTLEGHVTNATTNEPIRKVTIRMERVDRPAGGTVVMNPTTYTTSSDEGGKFAMQGIEPGQYRLYASRNGFVNENYGAHGHSRAGTTLTLTRQQHLKDINFAMTPQGVITGRVLDQDGDPLEYASVQVATYRYTQGRKQLQPSGYANTNDLGEYRLFGIAPGKYVLFATANSDNRPNLVDASTTPAPEEEYVSTYYPGTPDPAAAAQIDVAAGAQLRGIDLTLAKTRTITVKGHVTAPAGVRNAFVFVTPRNSGTFLGGMRRTSLDRNGNFELRVSPGSYYVTANAVAEGNRNYSARVPLDAGTSNIEGLNVTISPGAAVTGAIAMEADGTPLPGALHVSLQARDQGPVFFGSPAVSVKDGAFTVENVSPGLYNVNVSGLPRGYYVKSIRNDQTDVQTAGLDMSAGAPAAIRIVLSPNAPSLSGTVQDPKTGNPAGGATVVLVPQEKERRGVPQDYRSTTTDQNGAFTMTSIPPGEYKAYAWEDVDYGAYMDPDFLKPVEDQGEAVSLKEGEQKNVSLKMIPADQ